MQRARLMLILLLTILLAPALASATGSPREHDAGLFLRMTLGGGTGDSSAEYAGTEVEFSGPAGEFTLALGGIVAENLALHGTLFGFSLADPDVEVTGLGSASVDGSFTMSAFGGGLTWWFMPINLYLSGSAGFGVLSADNELLDGNSDTGFALELALGKEWFVSDRWGLGVGGGFTWHNIPDPEVAADWSGSSFSLRFSATFN